MQYHKLTGTPFVPPKWAFDYWMGGGWPLWNKPDSKHALENLSKVLDEYAKNEVKIGVAYLETDPLEETLCGLRDRGIRTLMWTNSVLAPFGGKSELSYTDYRVKKASNPKEVMNHLYIDLTSPASKDIINDKFEKPWEYGVCGEMVDFADSLPQDSICSNGKTGLAMHNEYAYWFGRRMNEAFYERLGDDFVLFQRSGCAGSQHYTASFGGDSYSSFLGLKRSVWEMLSAAASGISIWGSDIGGFMLRSWMPQEGPDFEEMYIRWVQFGAFSPLMRDHSWHGKHHPWANGQKGVENFKKYYGLRLQLLDKIYSSALKSKQEGGTVANSMAVAYGMSPAIDLQYMFCEDFLVRPIVELGQRKVNVIFPEDGFCDFYTGTYYAKGECEVDAPLEQIPLFVKPGSVIPYNYYGEDVVPTWEKENYREAVLLTAPTYKRESVFYTDGDACTFTSIPGECGYKVVASNFASYDFLRAIIGNNKDVELTFLIGPGKDAHSYDPTAQDLIKIQDSDLFVYVGGEMEKWSDKVLDSLDTDGTEIICIADFVETMEEKELILNTDETEGVMWIDINKVNISTIKYSFANIPL